MFDFETLSNLKTCQYLTGIFELIHMTVIHTALNNIIRLVCLQLLLINSAREALSIAAVTTSIISIKLSLDIASAFFSIIVAPLTHLWLKYQIIVSW